PSPRRPGTPASHARSSTSTPRAGSGTARSTTASPASRRARTIRACRSTPPPSPPTSPPGGPPRSWIRTGRTRRSGRAWTAASASCSSATGPPRASSRKWTRRGRPRRPEDRPPDGSRPADGGTPAARRPPPGAPAVPGAVHAALLRVPAGTVAARRGLCVHGLGRSDVPRLGRARELPRVPDRAGGTGGPAQHRDADRPLRGPRERGGAGPGARAVPLAEDPERAEDRVLRPGGREPARGRLRVEVHPGRRRAAQRGAPGGRPRVRRAAVAGQPVDRAADGRPGDGVAVLRPPHADL